MDDKINFIISAITDTQGTIRATDVKVGAMLAGMLVPIAIIENIWGYFVKLSSITPSWIAIIAGIAFFLMWILSIILLARTISAIDNPSKHIIHSSDYKGSFYGCGLFDFQIIDTIFNRPIIRANKDVQRFAGEYPDTLDAIISELSFEHLKLIYIRDIKLFRLGYSLKLAFSCLVIAVSVFFYSKLG